MISRGRRYLPPPRTLYVAEGGSLYYRRSFFFYLTPSLSDSDNTTRAPQHLCYRGAFVGEYFVRQRFPRSGWTMRQATERRSLSGLRLSLSPHCYPVIPCHLCSYVDCAPQATPQSQSHSIFHDQPINRGGTPGDRQIERNTVSGRIVAGPGGSFERTKVLDRFKALARRQALHR